MKGNFSLFDFGAIVAAAALAHDLGNPPFGHAGEDALSDFFSNNDMFRDQVTESEWQDLVKFEGNAQGFRILNQHAYGLKLTMATLGAFTKYPCSANFPGRDKSRKSQKKYGFFESELEIFKEIAATLELTKAHDNAWHRHPLAFLVEAADDICYSIIDLEDGCNLGLVSFDETVELLAPILKDKLDRKKLSKDEGLSRNLGTLRALSIGVLIDACTSVFLENEESIVAGKFDSALADKSEFRDALKRISEVSVQQIYRARQVVEIEAAGHEVLPGLLREFIQTGQHIRVGGITRKYENLSLLLPVEIRHAIKQAGNDYTMLRLVVDFVSGLTDKHALLIFRKIKGMASH